MSQPRREPGDRPPGPLQSSLGAPGEQSRYQPEPRLSLRGTLAPGVGPLPAPTAPASVSSSETGLAVRG